jgi:putative membrane protein insertion efficiency factor
MNVTPTQMLRALVRAYRYFVSPLLPQACRFYPSCSSYAEQALQDHGALRGGWLAAGRLCRCGPWHAGGFDPVPDVKFPARAPMQGQQ